MRIEFSRVAVLGAICLGLSAPMAFAEDKGIAVDVTLNPAGDFVAKTEKVEGFATKKGDTFTASNIKVDLGSLKTGIAVRDTHTKKYLEVPKHKFAILKAAMGKDGKGKGELTIKGITKPIEGTYEVEGDLLMAEFKVHLPDYNIKGIKYMGVGVEDDVVIKANVPVKK